MQTFNVQTPSGRLSVSVPADASVAALRQAVALAAGLAVESTKLVCGGCVLLDSDAGLGLAAGGRATLFALSAPPSSQADEALPAPTAAPAARLRRDRTRGEENAEDDEELPRAPLHPLLARLARRTGLPEPLVAFLFSRRMALFLIWCGCSKAAARHGGGEVFIMLSILALMALGLGKRKKGELSAYSLYNPGRRALPGAMSGEEAGRQISGVMYG